MLPVNGGPGGCLLREEGSLGQVKPGMEKKKAEKVNKDHKVPKRGQKRELKMTRECIYSRVYHAERKRSGGNNKLAQKKGQEAVARWLASV